MTSTGLSDRIGAIPLDPPRHSGYGLLDIVFIELSSGNVKNVAKSFREIDCGLGSLVIANWANTLSTLPKTQQDISDFRLSGSRVFETGAGLSAGVFARLTAKFQSYLTGSVYVSSAKADRVTNTTLLETTLKDNVHEICNHKEIKQRITRERWVGEPEKSVRFLVGVVFKSVRGKICSSSSAGKHIGAEAGGTAPGGSAGGPESLKKDKEKSAADWGTIGVCLAVMPVEAFGSNPSDGSMQLKLHEISMIRRPNDKVWKQLLSWVKYPKLVHAIRVNPSAPVEKSFVLGEALSGKDDEKEFAKAEADAKNRIPHCEELNKDAENRPCFVRAKYKSSWWEWPFGGGDEAVREDSHKLGTISFLHSATAAELQKALDNMKAGKKVKIRGFEVISIKPAVPFDSSSLLPIHYVLKPDDKPEDLPGGILYVHHDHEILLSIDPAKNGGKNSKQVIDASDKEWSVEESIVCLPKDQEGRKRKDELEKEGYHQLYDTAKMEDLKLSDDNVFVMCRHELLREDNTEDEDEEEVKPSALSWRNFLIAGASLAAVGVLFQLRRQK